MIVLLKLLNLHILVGKCTNHPVAQQIVLNPGIQLPDMYPLLFKGCPHPEIKIGAGNHHNGNQHKDNHRQKQIDSGKYDKGDHRLDKTDKKFFRTMVGKLCHVKKIIGNPGHQLPHLGIVKIAV